MLPLKLSAPALSGQILASEFLRYLLMKESVLEISKMHSQEKFLPYSPQILPNAATFQG